MKVLSLKIRFALAMSAIMLMLVVGLAAFALHHAKKDLLTVVSAQQLALVSRAGDDLDGKLKLAMDALTATAASIGPASLDSTASIRAVLMERPALRAIFDDVQITNVEGIIRGDAPPIDQRIGINLGSRAWFKRVIATGQPTISEPVRRKLNGEPIVSFGAPIKKSDGTIVGVMVGVLGLNKVNFLGNLGTAKVGQTGYIEVVSTWPKPQYVVHPDPGHILQEFSPSDSRALAKVLDSASMGTAVSTLEDGSKALIGYRPLAMTNWILVAVLPSEEAFGLIEAAKDRSISIAIASAVVLIPLIWLLAWGMLRPLTKLRDQVDMLTQHPDAHKRVTEGRNDEAGQLARAFNRLLEQQWALEASRLASEHERMQLALILEKSHDFVATTDAKGRVTYINASGRAARGLGSDHEVRGSTIADHYPAWATEKIEREAVPCALANGLWLGETAIIGADGTEVPIDHMLIAHRGATGRVEFFSSTMHDISDAKAASIAIRQSEARMASISDSVPMLIAFMDRDCRYRFVNSRCEEFLGRPRSEILGKTLAEVAGDEPADFYRPHFARAAEGETLVFDRDLVSARHSIHFKVKIIPQFDEGQGLIGFHFLHQDVTDYKVEQQRLSQLAAIDRLTGLANRSGFEAALTEGMHRSTAPGNGMALIYLDVDRFKSINDTHGHPIGDALLRAFAARITGSVRATDVVARLGGDEFVVVAKHLRNSEDVKSIAEKILQTMRRPFNVNGIALSITTSMGVAVFNGEAITADGLIERADAALYRAKNAGRDRYVFATDAAMAMAMADEGEAEPAPAPATRAAASKDSLSEAPEPACA